MLNAADPSVVAMAASCPGGVTFFARDRNHPVMATHRAQGHRIVYLEDGQIVAAQGAMRHRIALTEIPLTQAAVALVSGGKRHGRRRCRLGAGPGMASGARRSGLVHQRRRHRAGPLQHL